MPHSHDAAASPGSPTPPGASSATTTTGQTSARQVEMNGINVIAESERKGRPSDLFWPWFAANVSVLAMSYGAWLLAFGISVSQALLAGIVGIIASFLLVGFASLAGKRGSAPTMILSRATFGVRGNIVPTVVSYLILVGWEIVLVSLATLATDTVLTRLGLDVGNGGKVLAFLIVVAIIMAAGVLGFDAIMKVQGYITWATGLLTVVYVALTWSHINWSAVSASQAGPAQAVIGALVFAITAFGLSWANSASDYSRYLPRTASGTAVVWWTTFGASIAPIVLVIFGLLLAASDPELSKAIGLDPIGALTTLLPTWFLVPFAVVAILGLIGGAVLDIYSSGLTLLAMGLRIPRWTAVVIDGVLMVLGTIYVVWIAPDFLGPFQGFLITLGVPLAVWVGCFLADLLVRRQGYRDASLYDAGGRYGSWNLDTVVFMVLGTFLGWGLVTSSAPGFQWQGYLLGPLGLGGKEGAWAFANLGVLVAIAVGFVGYLITCRRRVDWQESLAEGDFR